MRVILPLMAVLCTKSLTRSPSNKHSVGWNNLISMLAIRNRHISQSLYRFTTTSSQTLQPRGHHGDGSLAEKQLFGHPHDCL